jgi:hypothetical protein
MDDIADLVLTPFRDIVEKGRTAVQNAGDTQPMLKASQALLKEGERALKRIEPLCKKHFDDYGPNFVAALRDNGEFLTRDILIDIFTSQSELTVCQYRGYCPISASAYRHALGV